MPASSQDIEQLIAKFHDKSEDEVFQYSDKLSQIGGQVVLDRMLELLYDQDDDVQYLACRTLSKVADNQSIIARVFEAINDPRLKNRTGNIVEALNGFDISAHFLDLFKIYLFGGLKASAMAKLHLDYEEFKLSPRMLKKAKINWNHYEHNAAHDDRFETKKEEVNAILSELEEMFSEH